MVYGQLCIFRTAFFHDAADKLSIKLFDRRMLFRCQGGQNTGGLAGGAHRVLGADGSLREKFRAKTSARYQKILNVLYHKRTARNFKKGAFAGIRRFLLCEIQRFAVNVYRIIGLAKCIGEFSAGQKIVSGYNIFRTDVAAFPHTDHGRDFCNIGVFKAFHVFLIKAELTKNSLFSLKLCARQMFDVGSVYIFKKFGIIKPNRTRPTGLPARLTAA